jgi:hypothetical protein
MSSGSYTGRQIKFAEGNFYPPSYSGNTQNDNTPNVNQASVLQTYVCFDKLSSSAARHGGHTRAFPSSLPRAA